MARRQARPARERAKVETYVRVEPLLSGNPRLPSELDGLLEVDAKLGSTRLTWLSRGPTRSSPSAIKAELEKHAFLAGIDAFGLDLSMLPPERRRFLATIGRRSTAQALSRRDPDRRYPILLALLQETAVDVLDEIVQLYDQAVSGVEGRAERKLEERLVARAKASEGRLALMDEMLAVVCDPTVPNEEVGAILRGRIGIDRLRAAKEAGVRPLPRDHGHLEMIEASYNHLRGFAPAVLSAIRFDGGKQARPLLRALEMLRELNATAGRRVPSDAPADFVPTRWRGYLQRAAAEGDAKAYRHYWELTVLLGLRDALRSGDVFVPGSRRYADPASYLMTPTQWETQRQEFCHLVGKPADPVEALAAAEAELHGAMADLEEVLASGAGPVRLNERGELVIPGAAQLLPRLLSGRPVGPVFLTDRRAPARTPALDVCPITGRARLSYRRAAELFTEATRALDSTGAGWTLHQLRHSDLTHEAEEGASTPMLLARSRHASVRSLERYARPSVDAVGAYVARLDPAARRRHPEGAIRWLI